jgi:hypothetical protein
MTLHTVKEILEYVEGHPDVSAMHYSRTKAITPELVYLVLWDSAARQSTAGALLDADRFNSLVSLLDGRLELEDRSSL